MAILTLSISSLLFFAHLMSVWNNSIWLLCTRCNVVQCPHALSVFYSWTKYMWYLLSGIFTFSQLPNGKCLENNDDSLLLDKYWLSAVVKMRDSHKAATKCSVKCLSSIPFIITHRFVLSENADADCDLLFWVNYCNKFNCPIIIFIPIVHTYTPEVRLS